MHLLCQLTSSLEPRSPPFPPSHFGFGFFKPSSSPASLSHASRCTSLHAPPHSPTPPLHPSPPQQPHPPQLHYDSINPLYVSAKDLFCCAAGTFAFNQWCAMTAAGEAGRKGVCRREEMRTGGGAGEEALGRRHWGVTGGT